MHEEKELDRRDDLESWWYTLFEIMVGPLPWRKLEKSEQLLEMKQKLLADPGSFLVKTDTPITTHCPSIVKEIKQLTYGDNPDYGKLRALLGQIMVEMKINMFDQYDWNVKGKENNNSRLLSSSARSKSDQALKVSEPSTLEDLDEPFNCSLSTIN